MEDSRRESRLMPIQHSAANVVMESSDPRTWLAESES
jgi:hypothetical protein